MSPPAPPPHACATITGQGTLQLNPQARFAIRVRFKSRTGTFEGSITYNDPVAGLSFESTEITAINRFPEESNIRGSGLANGTPVKFFVIVNDRKPDQFWILLSNGYSARSPVKQGNIKIREQC